MKNLSLNLSFLKKFISYGDRVQPQRDWFILLSIGFVLLLASMAWNVYLFSELVNGKTLGGSTPATVQKSAADSVAQVQDVFKARAVEEGNYQNAYHFVDPSHPGS